MPERKIAKKPFPLVTLIVAILIILIIVGAVVWFVRDRQSMEFTATDQGLSEEEISVVIEELGERMILPEGEEPFVAVITDVDALVAEQPFYTNASNGDYLIIYPQRAQAIIYSVTNDKIINVGPVEFDNSQAVQPETTGDIQVQSATEQENIFADEDAETTTTADVVDDTE